MSNKKIVRAWKDANYRNSLTEAERAALPANPAGAVEIAAEELSEIGGGRPKTSYEGGCSALCSVGCTYETATCSGYCSNLICP
jgi:mersacidin/lichenicidin family type 2 lantibiotic